ncbi:MULTISPECIES: hypothetical protein [unclassified Halanaerobium]|uniref:hypothetical protein n=1 Tax=unclassified Halanaerobium TaxID=2641197 RepID=UPI001F2AAEF3|nr:MULTISPECIES: hypothetical protein [unclassified Halanaerobium]
MFKNRSLIFITAAVFILIATNSISAFNGSSFYGDEKTSVEVGGEFFPEYRIMTDNGDLEENIMGEINFTYPGKTHEFKFLLDFQAGAAEEIDFDEAYYRYYGDKYHFLIGKHRLIWGTGDKVHVVDNLNPEDMSDFINREYKDRQIGEEMLKIDRYFRGGNASLEFVYTPDFNGHRLADDPDSPLGNWIINPFADKFELSDLAVITPYTQTDIINKFENSLEGEENQFGLRFTDSRQGVDYGFSYYKGYLREPSYNPQALKQGLDNIDLSSSISSAEFNKILTNADLHYDEVDIFGFELAGAAADINSRFELAYYRTDDTSGNNPSVKNNRIAWIIGGDRDLPINNINLNIQFKGTKILDDEQIQKNHIDYNPEGDYTSHRAIVKLKDSYSSEKIIPELTWIYNLNDNDYSLEAAVDYELQQDLHLELSHKIFNGDRETTFGQFDDNDFTSVGLRYSF